MKHGIISVGKYDIFRAYELSYSFQNGDDANNDIKKRGKINSRIVVSRQKQIKMPCLKYSSLFAKTFLNNMVEVWI